MADLRGGAGFRSQQFWHHEQPQGPIRGITPRRLTRAQPALLDGTQQPLDQLGPPPDGTTLANLAGMLQLLQRQIGIAQSLYAVDHRLLAAGRCQPNRPSIRSTTGRTDRTTSP